MKKIKDITSDETTFKGYPENSDKNFKFDTFNQWGINREPLGVTADEVISYLKELKTKKDDFSWIPIIAQDTTSPKTQKLLKFFRKLCSVLQFLENWDFKPGSQLYNTRNILQVRLTSHIKRNEGDFIGGSENHITLADHFDTTVYGLFKIAGIGAFGKKDSRDGTIKRTKLLEPEERYKKQRVFIYDSNANHYDILLHKDIIQILNSKK